jgi:hypothetical protein
VLAIGGFEQKQSNPDKVVFIGLSLHKSNSETFSDEMHLRYQKEQNIDLKLLRFNPDLGGKQENL